MYFVEQQCTGVFVRGVFGKSKEFDTSLKRKNSHAKDWKRFPSSFLQGKKRVAGKLFSFEDGLMMVSTNIIFSNLKILKLK